MWLKLGTTEIINLDYVSTVKKVTDRADITIVYHDLKNMKALSFNNFDDRDKAFEAIVQNLSRMKMIFE